MKLKYKRKWVWCKTVRTGIPGKATYNVRCPDCGKSFKSSTGLTQDSEIKMYVPAHKKAVKIPPN